ncbi:F-box/kelch-repeat protein SKIP11-like [Cornus florida]|uniref:F-box/kelch-repeat protein SKIP11-like n=1 Tax=Cornus florida TaxID=4283 RepID=UPI00289725A9|nr:F-box/kelch-repeat protein SKIP11-like [Cornus florida]XP_059655888.1 F-box/kelch-repeat protein SKIP11-like [Cornus florida]
MFEESSCVASRGYSITCEPENNWVYMNNSKRPLEIHGDKEVKRKLSKQLRAHERVEQPLELHDTSSSSGRCSSHNPGLSLNEEAPAERSNKNEQSVSSEDQSGSHGQAGDNSDWAPLIHQIGDETNSGQLTTSADQSGNQRQAGDTSDSAPPIHQIGNETNSGQSPSSAHQSGNEHQDGDNTGDQRQAGDNSDSAPLIHQIGYDPSINCLVRCSRSDYDSIASLNSSFHSLIRSGKLYTLRRQEGVIEHWIYISCRLLEWEAFDPYRGRWMHLPLMPFNECFMCSDKQSLAVGTELLVFGKELTSEVIYRYSLLTNTWTSGMRMNAPRCLFGAHSLREIAIFAGGCDSDGNILSTAELYNSETGTWMELPSMNKPRKNCAAVFMEGKFYVIGGIGGSDSKLLTCGEEYNLETRSWTIIPNMSPVRTGAAREIEIPATAEPPPMVVVANNEMYAADHADMEVRKYEKDSGVWVTVGRLPERASSMNGWGLGFRACGDQLIVIGGPRALGDGLIEINSWVPSEGPLHWNLLAQKQSGGNFVYNCAVMGC